MTSKRVIQHEGLYEWENSAWYHDKNCYPPSILEGIIERSVCYLTDASRFTFKLNAFAKHLEEEYVRPFDAHIFICRNVSANHPFGAHFDQQHNIIVQCEGISNWKVWDKIDDEQQKKLQESGENIKMNMDGDPILDVVMTSGDAIWIPKHYPHQVTSKTGRLSVSFPQAWEGRSNSNDFEERKWIKL